MKKKLNKSIFDKKEIDKVSFLSYKLELLNKTFFYLIKNILFFIKYTCK